MQLGLFLTARCNAACAHCSSSCGPFRSESLDRSTLFRLMDEAAAANEDERLEFSLSGGEPFLDFALLCEVIAHGAALGAVVNCQTNAYWAANDEVAARKLGELRDAGLNGISVSISRFHDAFIRRSRVQRALRVARELGLGTALKCAITADAEGDGIDAELERWARASGAELVEVFPVHPYLREGAVLPPAAYAVRPGLPEGRCPAPVLTVDEGGSAYSCCTPGSFNPFLRLGDVARDSIGTLYERYLFHGRQRLLRERGPAHLARALVARGLGAHLRDGYVDVCDLCSHIANDPLLAAAAAEVAQDYEVRQLSAMFDDMGLTRTDRGEHQWLIRAS
jgi:MoaA/NifB/PqqE/SkfB family radical SAM enzyme